MLFQIFFYFSGLIIVVGVVCLANFHISIPEEILVWLLQEEKRRGAGSLQEVIRQILREAREEAERHG